MDMKNRDQIPRTLALVAALVQHGQLLAKGIIMTNISKDKLRKFMKLGVTALTRLVEDEHHECWDGSVNTGIILSRRGTLI
jgi:hypothetical protein